MAKFQTVEQRQEAGARVREEVLGTPHVKSIGPDPFMQHFTEFTVDHCWGAVWVRPGLERKTRSMLNLAMLTAMARWHELEVHVKGALTNGVTEDEIAEVLLQAGVYAGVPVAAEGFRTAHRAIQAYRKSKGQA
jgi:4-carboxymuconolactone decarboxylase